MTDTFWPDLNFGPIHLFNCPKQFKDYNMQVRNIAADKRANSLKLNPAKRNINQNCKIIIEPARGVSVSVQTERIQNCIDQRNGRRF